VRTEEERAKKRSASLARLHCEMRCSPSAFSSRPRLAGACWRGYVV
jgi:hypothetical protein